MQSYSSIQAQLLPSLTLAQTRGISSEGAGTQTYGCDNKDSTDRFACNSWGHPVSSTGTASHEFFMPTLLAQSNQTTPRQCQPGISEGGRNS
jgi:hypothetical protein